MEIGTQKAESSALIAETAVDAFEDHDEINDAAAFSGSVTVTEVIYRVDPHAVVLGKGILIGADTFRGETARAGVVEDGDILFNKLGEFHFDPFLLDLVWMYKKRPSAKTGDLMEAVGGD